MSAPLIWLLRLRVLFCSRDICPCNCFCSTATAFWASSSCLLVAAPSLSKASVRRCSTRALLICCLVTAICAWMSGRWLAKTSRVAPTCLAFNCSCTVSMSPTCCPAVSVEPSLMSKAISRPVPSAETVTSVASKIPVASYSFSFPPQATINSASAARVID